MNFVAARAAFRRSSLPVANASGVSPTSLARFSNCAGRDSSSVGCDAVWSESADTMTVEKIVG